jgi:xanthosine utilization system XapX-like protein
MKGLIQYVAVGISLGFIFAVIGCFRSPSAGMVVMTILVGVVAFGLWEVAANWK